MTQSIETRLSALSAKLAAPFHELLQTGQLAEDIVHAVLDAGELSSRPGKLIGFAAGYLHLRACGIPVHDVIAMAKRQHRRINLCWSPGRWKEEHEKLSRAETLKLLAENNATYDLRAYEKHLPARFDGYLIRTSRRLGMEGLRQRHCVASYHERLANGSCAIAAVFAARQRWTVELKLTQDPEAPLRIAQIKTRHNALPSPSVRQQIHDILAIKAQTAAPAPALPEQDAPYMENLRRILPLLRQHAVQTVLVSFDGSGDSGSISGISYVPDTPGIKDTPVEILGSNLYFEDGRWHRNTGPQQTTIDGAIDLLTYDYLQETGVDWYNNDGGFGDLTIDVAAGTVCLEVTTRYTETQTAYQAQHDIATGNEL